MNNFLYFDIETIADPEAVKIFPEPTPPANYKDPEKIAAYIAEEKAKQISQAALDPDYGRVDAISLKLGSTGKIITRLAGEDGTEPEIIAWFWDQFKNAGGYSTGYNIAGFDLPYLMRRAMYYQIVLPSVPVLAKYRTEPTRDLMGILYNWNSAKSLKWVCKRYGINNPLPDIDGSMYAELPPDKKRAYSANDVFLVDQLYRMMAGVYFSADVLPDPVAVVMKSVRETHVKNPIPRKSKNVNSMPAVRPARKPRGKNQ